MAANITAVTDQQNTTQTHAINGTVTVDGAEIAVDGCVRSRSRAIESRLDKQPRVYLWPEGEGVLDNFVNRWSRPTTLYRKVAKAVLADLGIEGSLRWDQRAGCSCGCSPGFVLTIAPSTRAKDDRIHELRCEGTPRAARVAQHEAWQARQDWERDNRDHPLFTGYRAFRDISLTFTVPEDIEIPTPPVERVEAAAALLAA